ncbi:penicillin-binding protein [Desulfuribacillus alkaliarsenatis]|uniref:PASTA domain-containing protein n=1 Tax=Desulfuribacillus alkaliarsenatis TaxID=766136 RepID=A0A1E5G054_9FIRM|nr:PASTA domain-containing penicillin-binding protein [Desulfuribacillus alkaliarsenatis]OEF96079.1 hypothetical protein BHF68_10090 [Desulfuribacillus alkaliarsenatis]
MVETSINDKIRKKLKRRAIAISFVMAVLVIAVISRISYIQIVKADWLVEQAAFVWNKNSVLSPERGMILDRNKARLAYNAKAYTIIAHPRLIEDHVNTARKLAPVINMSEQRVYELITRDAYQVELGPGGRKISEELLNKVQELELVGISSIDETVRFYPNSAFASHIIGFNNAQEDGVTGIELLYQNELKGQTGKISYITDGRRREIPAGVKSYEPAQNGSDIVLTIDQNIQHFVERALDNAIEIYNPKNVTAIVADPQTGEILALANRPHYNLNYITMEDSKKIYQNLAISQFEPGSTFKIITLAAAIEENLVSLDDRVVDNGYINVPGGTIRTWNRIGFGEISILEAFERSSNVAFVKMGLNELGQERLFDYINRFGFGSQTGIELPNEMKGNIFSNRRLYPIEVATTSFGQGIAVTPLQQIQAVSAIANGGNLLKPTIIKEVSRKEGDKEIVIKQHQPTIVDTVISKNTAEIMKEAMESVVSNGSGQRARIEGYRIAGKTGTAQKVGPDGRYIDNKHIVSFIGFAPVENPRLIIYVAVDEPNATDSYGSTVTAPIFKEIMQDSLHYLGIKATENREQAINRNLVDVELYKGKYVAETLNQIDKKSLNVKLIGNGNYIVNQSVPAGEQVPEGTTLYLLTGGSDGNINPAANLVPDFHGMSKSEVFELLFLLEMDFLVEGNGYVINQSQEAGQMYDNSEPIHILFSSYSKPVLNQSLDE